MVASATPRPVDPLTRPVVAVAFSGGLDSTALLHATTRAADGTRVVALHVHHGLLPEADGWLAHCREQAALLGAAFACRRLDGQVPRGESVENWARQGRHAALHQMAVEAGADLLLLAHHRRDQAETFLLQAMRGAGLAGLAAMPRAQWRDGVCWARPWLDRPRELIEAYAMQHGLRWIEDPSNAQPRFMRNRVRRYLTQDFAGADAGLAQAARWMQEAHELTQELAQADLATLAIDGRLDLDGMNRLSPARASNALRAWLARQLGQPAPADLVGRLLREWRPGAVLEWSAPGGQLHAYRGGLYWVTDQNLQASDEVLDLSRPGLYRQAGWGGAWQVQASTAGSGFAPGQLARLVQRPRQGGEQFQRAPKSAARSLKKACQEAGLPPWRRHGPLLWAGADLIAVAGLGMDARAFASPEVSRLSLRWLDDSALMQSEGEGGFAA